MLIWFKTQSYGIFEFIVFLETKKYTGKPKFGKVFNKKARNALTQKILETRAIERIIFSICNRRPVLQRCTVLYYEKMVLTYVPYGRLSLVLYIPVKIQQK